MRHLPDSRLTGIATLLLVALCWGTTFVVIKGAVADVSPNHLTLARFVIAGIVFAPFIPRSRPAWGAGVELGFWLYAGYATQAAGLVHTSASRSAFITSISVVLVPAIAALAGRHVPRRIWVAAGMALAGVALLAWDGAPPNVGDAWTLLTALTYAIYVLRLEVHAKLVDTRRLTAAQLWGVVLFALAATGAGWLIDPGSPIAATVPSGGGAVATFDIARPGLVEMLNGVIPQSAWPAVIYLAVAATALTTWLQSAGQRHVSASEAALIYTTEPLWATLFAWRVLGEAFGALGWAGAGLIVVATLASQWRR